MTRKFDFGGLKLDLVELGSQGNAILGIRDSGKSYTATCLAEQLFEADVPFVAFDPIGIWRFLRVPGRHRGGKGYPVVVAGGKEGDLPLTESGAPEIVRAAMRNGVSLVIDLFDIKLSKAAWRRIVTQCVRVLLHENQSHGLRHVFLEEAAEFIPQKPSDWDVYNELEKLARMGGNSRLGYTLINQRSQEVSKAILELCENVFLHRQRGKNALENLDKWLSVAGADERLAILKSLPDLPQGDCWAWIGGDKPRPPMLVHVPRKNSLHPDRRVMRGDIAAKPKNAVNVGKFVDGMKTTLVAVEEEAKANDPALLRKQVAELQAELRKVKTPPAAPSIDKGQLLEIETRAHARGKIEGYADGVNDVTGTWRELGGGIVQSLKMATSTMEVADKRMLGILERASKKHVKAATKEAAKNSSSPAVVRAADTSRAAPAPVLPRASNPSPAASGDGSLTKVQLETLEALAWWRSVGHEQPTRKQLGGMLKIAPYGSTMRSRLASLTAPGLIHYPKDGLVALTDAGVAAAPVPTAGTSLVETIRASLTSTERATFDAIPENPAEAITREDLGVALGGNEPIQPNGSTMRSRLASLSVRELIRYPSNGLVARQDWVIG